MIWECWAPALLPGGMGGGPARAGVRSRVSCLHRAGGGAPVLLRRQYVGEFHAVPFRQGRHPSGWFWPSIARWLSITASTYLWPGNSTPRWFSSQISESGFMIRFCVSSVEACEDPHLAILAIFTARHMSDCSSCTWPPCLVIVSDMMRTYKQWVAAANDKIRLVP